MRDLLVAAIFFTGLIIGLKRPYIAALLWVWIGLMNPHRMGWGFAYDFPFAMVAAIALVISMAIHPDKVRMPNGGAIILLLFFVLWMGVTTWGAILFEGSFARYVAVLKVLMMTFAVASVIRTREEIVGLVMLCAGSIAFFGIKGGIFTIMTGGSYLVWGPPGSVVEGNNELAVALIVTVPLLYYLSAETCLVKKFPFMSLLSEKWLRRGLYTAIVLCMISAIGSQSRGALLSIAAMSSVFWWRSKSKIAIGAMIFFVGVFALMVMPESWMARMNTIGTYQEDASAMGRINAWTTAINIANDRFLGAGFDMASPIVYQRYAPDPTVVLVAHSIYFSVLGEHGYVGLLLYLGFWLATYSTAGRIMRLTAKRDDLRWAYLLGSMTKVSMVGFAVGGAFLSIAYWDMPYYIMVMLVCTEKWLAETLQQEGRVRADDEPLTRIMTGRDGLERVAGAHTFAGKD